VSFQTAYFLIKSLTFPNFCPKLLIPYQDAGNLLPHQPSPGYAGKAVVRLQARYAEQEKNNEKARKIWAGKSLPAEVQGR
jgi:hypothetical protein